MIRKYLPDILYRIFRDPSRHKEDEQEKGRTGKKERLVENGKPIYNGFECADLLWFGGNMKKLIERIAEEMAGAFERAGYDPSYARVTVSNRPDLCEYQCNGAMAAKKEYQKAPLQIAGEVAEAAAAEDLQVCGEITAVKPGFINIKVSEPYLAEYLQEMYEDGRLSVDEAKEKKTVIIDYGGPNVAKPLHVGHLRSAIIGESIKRTGRFLGHQVIGDVHLGDWGLQMGLIITELQERKPDLPYFDEAYAGEYPEEAPFTISELEEIYPAASARSKEDEAYRDRALAATHELQQGRRGYMALWNHIMNVSVNDLKANYRKLDVEFDLWKKESDAQPYIPDMIRKMKEEGYAYEDQGALIVDVKEETDSKEVPPCMLLKSDGASLYTTTDLATIVERMKLFSPDEILYVVDKRQEMHFIQVFRCARKTGLVPEETKLSFLGFGTMNGKDGKPFKTRDGGVMRLENLIREIDQEMYKKIVENRSVKDTDAEKTAEIVGLSAIKYGDLSNQASKDYVFDPERFTSFEGNTGPYILYTIVRIKSILSRFYEEGGSLKGGRLLPASGSSEKALMLETARFNSMVENAYEEKAPHKICSYIYELSNDFNRFYHETRILTEEDGDRKLSWLILLDLVRKVLEQTIDLLGFSAPERM
jgi:arginyl-tRNA synthetase